MLAALAGAGIEPDLVLGTSIGGINGAFVAAHPVSGVTQLASCGSRTATRRCWVTGSSPSSAPCDEP